MQTPNYRTICSFRRKNITEIIYFFIEIAKRCKELKYPKVGNLQMDEMKV